MEDSETRLLRRLEATVLPIILDQGTLAGVHGSGIIFCRGERHYLVTAAHVAKFFREHGGNLGLPSVPQNTDAPIWTIGVGQLALTAEETEDVAVLLLKELAVVDRLRNGGWRFLSDADIATVHHEERVVFGWPHAQSRFDGDELTGRPVAFRLPPIAAPPGSSPHDVFVGWPSRPIPALDGISGSPLWDLSPNGEMKLVGVQHSVQTDVCIRGTKWSVVDELIQRLDSR
jgi:hypothetical protein